MRRLIAILAALILVAGIPAAVTAGRPNRFVEHFVSMFCDGLAPESGTGFLFLGVNLSEEFGPGGFVEMWNTDEPVGAPDIRSEFDTGIEVTIVNGHLTASIPLLDESGDPAGTGTVDATLTPVGDPFTIEDHFRDGNVNVRITSVVQPLAPQGTAVIDGKTFNLETCFAEDTDYTEWFTNPTAFTNRATFSDAGCDLTNDAGDTAFLFLDLTDAGDVFVDATLIENDEGVLGAVGFVTLTGGSGSGALDLYDPETGTQADGQGSIELSVAAGGAWDYLLKAATFRQVVRGQLVDIEGQLTFPGYEPFDLTSCVGFSGTSKVIFTNPRGPKPSGKVPSNDLPSGAKLLSVGARTSQSTRGASIDQEAPYPCMTFEDFGEIFEIPVLNTVWFKVQGTGSDVTVDTAGSDFDTVAAAYTASGSTFTSVACVDDVPLDPIGRTLQSAVTFPTAIGTTYYVQIGGFPDVQSYGNLRVAVR